MFLRTCMLLALLGGWLAPNATAAAASDFLKATEPAIGTEPYGLPYRYLVPPNYQSGTKYPLIIFLHGIGECGTDNEKQMTFTPFMPLVSTANQAAYPCFMIVPQANPTSDSVKNYRLAWDYIAVPQVVRAIRTVQSSYNIDPDRIYVTGLSSGGFGTFKIISDHPTLFAAAVPMSGGNSNADKTRHIPQWVFHGALDDVVKVADFGDPAVKALRMSGARVIYTRYADGKHDYAMWSAAYGNPYLLPWMMAQRRNQPMAGVPNMAITNPAAHILPPSSATTLNVQGTVTLPANAGSPARVGWTFDPASRRLWDTDGMALATGTTSWSATAATGSTATLLLAMAEAPSLTPTLGGLTTLNDYRWNVPLGANTAAPTVVITAPSTTGSWSTNATTMTLSGTAQVASGSGKTVKQVTWGNNRGGSGQAIGTTSWSIADLGLAQGINVISVTVRDSVSITASTTLMITVGAAIVTTTAASAITATTATAGGNVTASGNSTVTARGVCWSTAANPTIAGNKTTNGTGTGLFTSALTGLVAGTAYHVRAYATNSAATTYGADLTFTTAIIAPTVTTTAASAITATTATAGGNVTTDGGASVTARGVCWATAANPTIAGNKTTNGTGTGSFTSALTGLAAGTTYHVRAYATNSAATTYGADLTFTTATIAPTVTTTAASAITATTATAGGNVTADGGASITARGVCWSTAANPTIAGSRTANGTGTGSFTSALTGLAAGTTYHIRAYATNSAGTAYGADLTVVTAAVTTTYNVIVTNGSGGGAYAVNATVQIHADPAPSGQQFDHWDAPSSVTLGNTQLPDTSFTMPAQDVTVTAQYAALGQGDTSGDTGGEDDGGNGCGIGSAVSVISLAMLFLLNLRRRL